MSRTTFHLTCTAFIVGCAIGTGIPSLWVLGVGSTLITANHILKRLGK